jgi:hypothetical protein
MMAGRAAIWCLYAKELIELDTGVEEAARRSEDWFQSLA